MNMSHKRFLIFLPLCALLHAEFPPGISLPITGVTVYEDRALVQRSGEVEIVAGATTVRIVGLPPDLHEASLRASLPEGQRARVSSATTRTEERQETQDERLRGFEKERDDLDRSLRQIEARSGALNDSANYLQAFEKTTRKGLSERATLGTITAQEMKESMDFLSTRRSALLEEQAKIGVEREVIEEKLADLREKISQISTPSRKTVRYAEVLIESPANARTVLSIGYLIGNAWWAPRYEARLAGAKLEVQYAGEVRQQTGEAWENVALVLSTARPSLGANRPELLPQRLVLHAFEAPKGVVSVGVEAEAPGRPDAGTEAPGGPEAPPAVEARESGVSVAFKVPGKSTVPSDRRSHKLPIISFSDPAPALSLETIPKALRYVYLKCQTSNKTGFPMLAGAVDVFRESGFMGTATLPFTAPGKPLELSFGIDEDLKVRRTPDPERTKVNTSAYKKEFRYAFDTEVANYKAEPQTVLVVDNFPIADVEEVTVRLDAVITPRTSEEAKSGRLEWKLTLAPGEKKSVHLEYTITMPKDYQWQAFDGSPYIGPTF